MPQSQDVNPNVVFRQPEVEFILKKKKQDVKTRHQKSTGK